MGSMADGVHRLPGPAAGGVLPLPIPRRTPKRQEEPGALARDEYLCRDEPFSLYRRALPGRAVRPRGKPYRPGRCDDDGNHGTSARSTDSSGTRHLPGRVQYRYEHRPMRRRGAARSHSHAHRTPMVWRHQLHGHLCRHSGRQPVARRSLLPTNRSLTKTRPPQRTCTSSPA